MADLLDVPQETRLTIILEALEKIGKTTTALTAADPIAYFDLAHGGRGALRRARAKGKRIIYGDYYYEPPLGLANEASIFRKVAEEARPIWKRFRLDYMAQLKNPKVRTLVIDDASIEWKLKRYAAFGRLQKILPVMYAPVNAELMGMVLAAQRSDKNVIYIHRLEPEWSKPVKGESVGSPTGRLIRQGWKEMGYEADAAVRLEKDDGERTATITNTRYVGEDEVLTGKQVRMSRIFATIMGNSPKDWL